MRSLIPFRRAEVWDPFEMVRDIQDEMNRVFERSAPAKWNGEALLSPAVDVKEEKDEIVVHADLPGLKKEDVRITVDQGLLTLKGERKESQERKGKDFYYAERFFGSFSRTLELPAKVKADAVKASYKDGVLEIRLPKDAAAKPREIKVEVQ